MIAGRMSPYYGARLFQHTIRRNLHLKLPRFLMSANDVTLTEPTGRFDGCVIRRPEKFLVSDGSLPTQSPLCLSIRSKTGPTLASFSTSSQAEQETANDADGKDNISTPQAEKKNIIGKDEKGTGEAERKEFKAETKMLLDIVAKSLYSEPEIFIRELISNASDAIEKFRYSSLSGEPVEAADRSLEIHIGTDKMDRTFTIQDTGIGMTKEEMIENLGTIAKSGSKAFLEKLKEVKDKSAIIGQFGVGFYSSFMVANKVEVYSKSSKENVGHKWTTDGTGSYDIQEAEGVRPGTKIIVYLKGDMRKYCDETQVKDIVKKYSSFVNHPIYLNGDQINTLKPLWMVEPKSVAKEQHLEFYRFISASYDAPRFSLHFKTDVPIALRCLLYFPEGKPGMFSMNPDAQVGVSLYSRNVMIKSKADNVIPQWLRFVKGVVDSEDIPLNLSRELLQDGPLIRKLKSVIISKAIQFLYQRSQKEPEEYDKFFLDYGLFLKEGIVLEPEQTVKEDIARLLRFESSLKSPGEIINIPSYIERMQPAQKDIYYLSAPSRELADRSPYMQALKEKNFEVIYCYQPYDEIVLLQLRQFGGKPLVSVEKEMRQMKDDIDIDSLPMGSLSKSDAENLVTWLKDQLKGRANEVKITSKLGQDHPCVVTVEEMGAARHFVKTQFANMPRESRYAILQPRFEINVMHPIIKKLSSLKDTDLKLAQLLSDQLFSNAMITAGLEEDPRTIISNLNELLTKALEKC